MRSYGSIPGRVLRALLMAASAMLVVHCSTTRSDTTTPVSGTELELTTVYLVRHAEKGDTPPQDPPLSEQGKQRAQELARRLESAGIKAIYTSQYARTRQTAEPLATRLGITAVEIPVTMNPANPREIAEQSYTAIIEGIRQHPGDPVLVVGHSNTIPEIIKRLGADTIPTIDEKSYDDLFIASVFGNGKTNLARMKY
jgi:phosphohistidine phosphatase SixA